MSMKFNVPDDDAQEQPSLEKLLESTMQWAATQIADDFKKIGCEFLLLGVVPETGVTSVLSSCAYRMTLSMAMRETAQRLDNNQIDPISFAAFAERAPQRSMIDKLLDKKER